LSCSLDVGVRKRRVGVQDSPLSGSWFWPHIGHNFGLVLSCRVEQPLQGKSTCFTAAGSIDDKIDRHILHPVIDKRHRALVWCVNAGDRHLAWVLPKIQIQKFKFKNSNSKIQIQLTCPPCRSVCIESKLVDVCPMAMPCPGARTCENPCSGPSPHTLISFGLPKVDPVYGLVLRVAKSMTPASVPGSAITANRSIGIVTP
jgi:hypothetical protein